TASASAAPRRPASSSRRCRPPGRNEDTDAAFVIGRRLLSPLPAGRGVGGEGFRRGPLLGCQAGFWVRPPPRTSTARQQPVAPTVAPLPPRACPLPPNRPRVLTEGTLMSAGPPGTALNDLPPPKAGPRRLTAALVGNPNTGKTTLFNALSGLNQRV